MLGLKLPTDPFWVKNVVENNLEEILSDHAYCEQKAASNAISIMVNFPEYPELAKQMAALAREELEHYEKVVEKIQQKGMTLGRERKDEYVNKIRMFMQHNGSRNATLIERLLFAALIEARSCERFKVLATHIKDADLAQFYKELMVSEANHYTFFIKWAKKIAQNTNIDVDKRWKEYLDYEARIITQYGKKQEIHG
jgi:tRNA-(ms[2]io[6]A)-hydroxylase